ncbi:hypothetical protein [Wenxinia marina]|uniref:Uncharacterized protein n=1 Tax=Wenxinia marina DSM 24838 TaxID=1123501 RepID=A0A0D0QD24_9RHOB|nr:hypothetical protein [Wenxinia marina]KIQ70197.1 hypothetical protein Wenmar_01156 [Wenxinia marina DSM 24838]GGL50694.1 hypothetical protein GCM10011392_01010 [Wenxinia marina]
MYIDTIIGPVRRRTPPLVVLYGGFAEAMRRGERFRAEATHRAAYVYVTGAFPTHLRREKTEFLRHITRLSERPSSLDGRIGGVILKDGVAKNLELEEHTMVQAVRQKMQEGYRMSLGRPYSRRRYDLIRMVRDDPDQGVERLTINRHGFEREGW